MGGSGAFRLHARVFAAGACALSAANWWSGPPWWSFWLLAAWAVAFSAHYLVRKAGTVDDAWVEERTADLHSKSYDVSHIDRIAEDQAGKSPAPRPKH